MNVKKCRGDSMNVALIKTGYKNLFMITFSKKSR